MFPNTLSSDTSLAFSQLKPLIFIKSFYLAGGTALALQLGHRKSIDLDFFIEKLPPQEILLDNFKDKKINLLLSDKTGINLILNKTKISFLQYPYPLLEPFIDYEGIKLASVIDIACMKLNAVAQRGEKKDFYDLYEILEKYTLSDLLTAFDKKFAGFNFQKLSILKSLIYFDDAEKNPEPVLINDISWEAVKKGIFEKVSDFTKKASNL